jgi:hypothetical protein
MRRPQDQRLTLSRRQPGEGLHQSQDGFVPLDLLVRRSRGDEMQRLPVGDHLAPLPAPHLVDHDPVQVRDDVPDLPLLR